jgi:hypothetical protein
LHRLSTLVGTFTVTVNLKKHYTEFGMPSIAITQAALNLELYNEALMLQSLCTAVE